MANDLVETLKRWCGEYASRLARDGVTIDFVESEDGSGGRVDLWAVQRVARATVWRRGYCDLEVLDAESGAQIEYQHHDAVDERQLESLLMTLARRLAAPAS